MCAECDRLEAERNTGKLRDVAARAFADFVASAFLEAGSQATRNLAWDKFALTGNALIHAPDPNVPVTLKVNRDVS